MLKINFYNQAIVPVECVANAWTLYTQRFWFFLGVCAFAFFVGNFIPVASFFVYGLLICGVYFCFIKHLSGAKIEFEDLFKSFNNFFPALLIGLLYSVSDIAFQILNTSSDLMKIFLLGNRDPNTKVSQSGSLTAAGIWSIILLIVFVLMTLLGWTMKTLLFFALPLVAEHNLGTTDAIGLSASAARKNFVGIILILLFQIMVAAGGTAICCVGVFFVMPIIYGSTVFAYRQAFPKFGVSS